MNEKKYCIEADLLKIICMFFIVLSHGISYSNIGYDSFFANFLSKFSILANNIFVLITGYLSSGTSHTKGINKSKLIKMFLKADFISWLLLIYMIVYGYSPESKIDWVYSLLPVVSGGYWFVTCYLILNLMLPALDLFVNASDESFYKHTLVIFIVIICVLCVIPYSLEIGVYHGYSIVWFCLLYLIGQYYKRYSFNHSRWLNLLISTILLFAMSFISYMVRDFSFKGVTSHLNDLNNVVWLYVSFSIFSFIIRPNKGNEKHILYKIKPIVRSIANASLGIYLLHMQPLLKQYLWTNIIVSRNFFGVIFNALIIWILCLLISLCIERIFKFDFNRIMRNKK